MDALPNDAPVLFHSLVQLWDERRRSRAMPTRSDFPVEDLKPWLGRLALIEVVDDESDFLFRLYGSALAERFGMDLTGKRLSEISPSIQLEVSSGYHQCVREARPIFSNLRYANREVFWEWQRLLLPLSSDGTSVTMIMMCLHDPAIR